MHALLRPLLFCASVLLLTGCSSREEALPNPAPPVSTNAAVFDPGSQAIPLPNILVTATAGDPLAKRAAGTPMTPPEALAYINTYEMGSTQAVAGVNAPIYLRFEFPVQKASVNASTIKVFQLTADAAGTENGPLGFQDITGMFTFQYTAGGTDVWLFPSFPLIPGTRYAYVVTNKVLDAGTGAPVIPSFYFNYLKSTTALTGAAAPLEPIRANTTSGAAVLLSGYAKVMDDLIAATAKTTITSRDDIVLLGRFITSGAGFIVPDPAAPTTRIPVETALRAFAAGAGLPNGLQGKTWTNSIAVKATFTKGNANPLLDVGAYWQGATGYPAASVPPTLGAVVQGSINSAFLGMDPVVARANAASMDLTAQAATAFNPASGVVQPFRDAQGHLVGYYHVPTAIPFVYLAPAAAAPTGGYPLVLFQHGITKEKETALALAQALTGAGYAILAIDLPLHGELAPAALQFKAGDDAAAKAQKEGAWGAAFMAVGAPLSTRSNVQQAAFNLHRLELTVATGGFLGLGALAPSITRIQFAGQSLGSIVGAYYLAGNTGLPYTQTTLDASMKGFLSVPGGRLAYLIQASPAFSKSIDDGLAAQGLAKGSPGYNGFFQLTQTVVDTVDPATMTTPLVAGLPSRFSGRLLIQEATTSTYDASGSPVDGDLVITNPFTRYFGNALGGRAVLGTSDAAAVAPGFFQLGYGAADRVPATFMYTLNGALPAPKTQPAALTPLATAPKEGYFQFDQAGISHGGLLDPAHPANAALMQAQLVYFLGASGTSIALDPTVLGQ
jgi:hypothetical protein